MQAELSPANGPQVAQSQGAGARSLSSVLQFLARAVRSFLRYALLPHRQINRFTDADNYFLEKECLDATNAQLSSWRALGHSVQWKREDAGGVGEKLESRRSVFPRHQRRRSQTYKPSPATYQLAAKKMRAEPGSIRLFPLISSKLRAPKHLDSGVIG